MTERDTDIPQYAVHRRGKDVMIHSMGHAVLARLVAIIPGLKASANQFNVVETSEGIGVHRLHEVSNNKASLFVLTAVEPDATSKLDAAEKHIGQIANIWHNPEEGIRALFPHELTDKPLAPHELTLPEQPILP